MYIDEDKIGNIIKDLDRFKFHLLETVHKTRKYEFLEEQDTTPYHQPKSINGYKVYQFAFEGSFPLNDWSDKDLIEKIKAYIQHCTFNVYNESDSELPLSKAKIYIEHYFSNGVISDLDNRNHKYLLDALRYSRVILDDNWKNISLDISGFRDVTDHVQVYVVAAENKLDFINYLEENRYNLIQKPYPFDEIVKYNEEKFLEYDPDFWK
ncbi:hypothetical protein [Oceanobacillus oncorhynchi]|uniref:hypothetical protein n=2 Tax=Oceanobacillus TaxID=182709 RepID=UPI000595F3B0|nr:hypothetical protein [Oceanobacillus oncorhynchi]